MTTSRGAAYFVPHLLIVALLSWALVPSNPYGYYQVMRWIVCAAFAFLAVRSLGDRPALAWVWIACAGIYNPIIPVHSTRAVWSVVNVATIAAILVGAVIAGRRKPDPTP